MSFFYFLWNAGVEFPLGFQWFAQTLVLTKLTNHIWFWCLGKNLNTWSKICWLTCKLAQVENIQALSIGLMAFSWVSCKEGMGLEMIGGWGGGRKVYGGSVTEVATPSEPYPKDKMAFSEKTQKEKTWGCCYKNNRGKVKLHGQIFPPQILFQHLL